MEHLPGETLFRGAMAKFYQHQRELEEDPNNYHIIIQAASASALLNDLMEQEPRLFWILYPKYGINEFELQAKLDALDAMPWWQRVRYWIRDATGL